MWGLRFGGIGASREMMFASLAEPAMIMIVFTVALVAGSTQLSTVADFMLAHVTLRVSLGLALVGLITVALAENARIPVDNPATHLELTMVHEAMVLEYSGRHLAVLELAAALKLLLYISLIACIFFPWGLAPPGSGPAAYAIGRVELRGQAHYRRIPPRALRDLDRQDARVPRTGIPRCRAHARPARHAAAFRLAELLMATFDLDTAHMLAGGMVLVSFMLLYQDRMFSLLNVFALHAFVLSLSVAWQAYIQNAPHLYVTAAIALVLKAIIIPVALHRVVVQLGIHRTIETVGGIGTTMLLGIGLVALSMVVMLRAAAQADPLAREDLALALSVVLLGLLMMVTRRNAVSQIVGFMSLENGLILAAAGAKGMPLVVEISVAFSVLVAFIVIGVFLFRIRERFDSVDVQALDEFRGERQMNLLVAQLPFEPVTAILVIPGVAALLLALLPGYKLTARLNVFATFLTFLAALSLLVVRPATGTYLFVDDLNVVFIVLGTFVGFTTSAFSASYIEHEIEIGRLTPAHLRFYHAMYQALMFAMNLGLLANNIGLMWVAIELATLTTVLMVGIYRTPEALEAAWKYFILGSVGIALALFGTILVYMAARPVIGEGHDAMVWTTLIERAKDFSPELLNVAFVFLMLGYGTKVGLAPLHAWLPDAHAEGPTPISAVLSGLLLNVALYAVLRFKMLLAANPAAIAPGPLMVTLGLVSLIFAGFMLYRRRDIKRLFAYSSIEHMGLITFAFGMGGPLANFAGLLHMTMHSLTKSAIFFTVGHISQVKGTQKLSEIRGLTESHPLLGWGLVLGVVAIAGLPPLGIFMSEFLIVSSTFAREPLARPSAGVRAVDCVRRSLPCA